MPALPNVANVIKTIFKHGFSTGEDVFNILYFAYTGTNTDALMNGFATYAGNQWSSRILTQGINQDLILNEVTAEDLTSNTAPVGAAPFTQAGSGTGTYLPTSSAICISKEIARRYRGGHPRLYLAGMEQDFLASPTTWHTTPVNTFVTGMADFIGDVTGHVYGGGFAITDLVNVSYQNNHAQRVTPVVDTVLSVVGHPRVCSQRRRLGKTGG